MSAAKSIKVSGTASPVGNEVKHLAVSHHMFGSGRSSRNEENVEVFRAIGQLECGSQRELLWPHDRVEVLPDQMDID